MLDLKSSMCFYIIMSNMQSIEIEIRSFLTQLQYKNLLKRFKMVVDIGEKDYQETYYFDKDGDFRISLENKLAKLWCKKGKIHESSREEIEVIIDRDQFEKLKKMVTEFLGYDVMVSWIRERYKFEWKGIKVCLDYTKDYGYILELEKMVNKRDKESVLQELRKRLKELGITETSKEVFDRKYKEYIKNWKEKLG